MTVYRIPTRQDAEHYSIQIELDTREFLLIFDFNRASALWYMTIAQLDGTILLAGIAIVLDTFLLAPYADNRLPTGDFLAYSTTKSTEEAGATELGTRVILTYTSADSLP